MKKQISIILEEEEIETIDYAAELEKRSRSAFITYHSLNRAKQLKEGKNDAI